MSKTIDLLRAYTDTLMAEVSWSDDTPGTLKAHADATDAAITALKDRIRHLEAVEAAAAAVLACLQSGDPELAVHERNLADALV